MLDDGDNVSVIVRCKDEDRFIGFCIQALLDLIDNPEIIVMNDNSTDESLDVVRMFDHHASVQIHNVGQYSPGKALNDAVSKASAETILIISAHCILTQFDHNGMCNHLSKHVAVFGKQIPIYRGRRITPRYIWSHFVDNPVENMRSAIENRQFLHNGMAIYTKDILSKIPFDEYLYGKEDRYWAEKIVSLNYSYLYDPDFKCTHHWTPNGATWKGIG